MAGLVAMSSYILTINVFFKQPCMFGRRFKLHPRDIGSHNADKGSVGEGSRQVVRQVQATRAGCADKKAY